MNAPMPMSAGGDFGADRLSPARLRTLAQVVDDIAEAMDVGDFDSLRMLMRGDQAIRVLQQLAEAARALDTLADTIVRGEVGR